MSTGPVVEVSGLRREYAVRGEPPRVALEGLDLSVAAGETHGLLGPNGAGKTTLVKILSTVLLPTSGTARVLGEDVVTGREQVRSRIGIVLGGERGLYLRVSVRRNMLFWCALHGLDKRTARSRTDMLLERTGLLERADSTVEQLSRGMMQRVHLARALVGRPEVLFLDEPTVGLDPVAALEFRGLIAELRAEGRTVLLTTHDLAEAEALCDRVSVIDRGVLLMTRDTATIGRLLPSADRVDFTTADPAVVEAVRLLPSVVEVSGLEPPQRWRALPAGPEAVGEVLRLLVERGVTSVSTSTPSLEEVYLQVIGERGMSL